MKPVLTWSAGLRIDGFCSIARTGIVYSNLGRAMGNERWPYVLPPLGTTRRRSMRPPWRPHRSSAVRWFPTTITAPKTTIHDVGITELIADVPRGSRGAQSAGHEAWQFTVTRRTTTSNFGDPGDKFLGALAPTPTAAPDDPLGWGFESAAVVNSTTHSRRRRSSPFYLSVLRRCTVWFGF
jgi:hypothetical protein